MNILYMSATYINTMYFEVVDIMINCIHSIPACEQIVCGTFWSFLWGMAGFLELVTKMMMVIQWRCWSWENMEGELQGQTKGEKKEN